MRSDSWTISGLIDIDTLARSSVKVYFYFGVDYQRIMCFKMIRNTSHKRVTHHSVFSFVKMSHCPLNGFKALFFIETVSIETLTTKS